MIAVPFYVALGILALVLIVADHGLGRVFNHQGLGSSGAMTFSDWTPGTHHCIT
jgi:hypothetical protein